MKIPNPVFFLAMLVGALLTAAPARADVDLRSAVVLDGTDVRISDIFVGAADNSIIARTPPPGRRLVLDASALQRLARKHGVKWRASSRFVQSVITRDSRILEISEIEEALLREFSAHGMPEGRRIELSNRSANIRVAANLAAPFTIENPAFNARTDRVSAILSVATGNANPVRYRLDGFSYAVVEVPVLTRRIRRQETIATEDVVWKKFRKDLIGRNAVLDRDSVVGQAARRYLAVGKPLRIDDLEPPKLVRKGDLVTIYFETNNLRLTAKARALEDGAKKETIRVVNIRSKKVVEAVVSGPTKVMIPTDQIASSER